MELVGGSLSGYGAIAILPSKADRIMSRYRPIAPKPTMPCVSEADRSASSAISFDNLRCRQVPDAATTSAAAKQKSRRVRKRQKRDTIVEDSPRPIKRAATVSISKPDSEKLKTEKGLSCGLVVQGAQMMINEDAGFMERAAASAPSSVFPPERRRKAAASNNQGYGGCFTEMIRGIAGLPTAAHVHNLLQQQQQQQQQAASFLNVMQQKPFIQQSSKPHDLANTRVSAKEAREYAKNEFTREAFWSCVTEDSMRVTGERVGSEEQQQSGLDEEGYEGDIDGRRGLITLDLLPDAPSRGDSPTVSSCSSSSQSVLPHNSASSNSYAYIDQVYGRSSEPVVLVEDCSQKVLWVNQGYERACKDISTMLAPFIDPLGIPTRLGQFKLQLDSHSGSTSATLWGFLKKLVVETANQETTRWVPYLIGFPPQDAQLRKQEDPQSAASSKGPMLLQQHNHEVEKSNGPIALSNAPLTSRVIMPQPIRLVGSAVSLVSITEVQENTAMAASVELVEKQLEEGSLPAFITDASNLVRWVNTAYKHMVGQPECPWFVSTVKTGGGSPTITGEVLLSCDVEIPLSAASFSGRANIQWTRNTGERSCMTVPCDVSSLIDSNCKRMLVWRFDIQASLSLTCGV